MASILIGWGSVHYFFDNMHSHGRKQPHHLSKSECAKQNVNNCQLGINGIIHSEVCMYQKIMHTSLWIISYLFYLDVLLPRLCEPGLGGHNIVGGLAIQMNTDWLVTVVLVILDIHYTTFQM